MKLFPNRLGASFSKIFLSGGGGSRVPTLAYRDTADVTRDYIVLHCVTSPGSPSHHSFTPAIKHPDPSPDHQSPS